MIYSTKYICIIGWHLVFVMCKSNYLHASQVWQLHIAEQMVLDDEENRAAGIITPTEELNEVNEAERDYIDADTFWTEEVLGDKTFDSLILVQNP